MAKEQSKAWYLRFEYQRLGMLFLMLIAVAALIYVGINAKAIVTDPCDYCEKRTGGTCYRGLGTFAEGYGGVESLPMNLATDLENGTEFGD